MEKFKEFLVIDCYSFTAVSLFNATLVATGRVKEGVSIEFCLHIFLVTSIIAGLILITDEVCKGNSLIRLFFHLVDVMMPVLGYIMLTQRMAPKMETIIRNIVICILLYGLIYLLMVMSWKEKDQKANESLEKMRAARKKKD